MSIAVTAWKGYAQPVSQAAYQRSNYQICMNVTGLAADVDHDIGDLSGNFWTEAEADATYGDVATALKDKLTELAASSSHSKWSSELLESSFVRVAGAPGGATEYQVAAVTDHIPEIAFFAANAPTAYTLVLDFVLKTEEWPKESDFRGTGI